MTVRERDSAHLGAGDSAGGPPRPEGRSVEWGASAIEYALLVGFIAIVILAAVTLLGVNVADMFSSIATGY